MPSNPVRPLSVVGTAGPLSSLAADPDSPATISIQPLPIGLKVAHKRNGSGMMTAISRDWREGDAALCRYCPRDLCVVDFRDNCLVLLPRFVPFGSAARATLISPGDGMAGEGVDHNPDGP